MGGNSLRPRQQLLHVLLSIWRAAPTTKSNFSRINADWISALSSEGEITTAIYPGSKRHGRHWKLTPKGIRYLWKLSRQEKEYLKSHVIKEVAAVKGADSAD